MLLVMQGRGFYRPHTPGRANQSMSQPHMLDTAFDQHGIECIPDRDRNATVFDFMRIEWGGANSLATAVLGAFPIIFGLSLWQALAAALIGVLVGACILAPMALFGPLTGTNN